MSAPERHPLDCVGCAEGVPDHRPTFERQVTYTIYVCPECGSYQTPDGSEAEYGPPECSHGRLFGSTPDGGGEAEMEAIQVVAASPLVEENAALRSVLKRVESDIARRMAGDDAIDAPFDEDLSLAAQAIRAALGGDQ
jgi:DNA-directed RNA polymerase subunit RPC12/RpoP